MSHSAPQQVVCQACQQRYPWRAEFAGKKVRCPKCHAIFVMPAAPGAAQRQSAPALALAPETAHGPTCPSCGAPLAPQAILCVACGYDLRTGLRLAAAGAPPGAAAGSSPDAPPELPAGVLAAPERRHDPIHDKPVTLLSILGVAVRGELVADALVVVAGWLGWVVAIIATAFVAGFISLFGPVGAMAGLLGILLVAASAYGWVAKQYMSVTQQFESGGLVGQIERSNLHCFGMFLIVSAISFGPLWIALRYMPPPDKSALTLGVIITSLVWGLLYWPMGVAVAGAYWTLNPLVVARKILRSFPTYLVVLVFIVLVVGAAYLLAIAALLATAVVFPNSPMALLTAIGVASLLPQYGLMASVQVWWGVCRHGGRAWRGGSLPALRPAH